MNQSKHHLTPNTIVYPSSWVSEFEIQAELYSKLNACGIITRGCVMGTYSDGIKLRTVYFDLVVFKKDYTPVCIIEVKKDDSTYLPANSFQKMKYEAFCTTLLHCGSVAAVNNCVLQVLKLLDDPAVVWPEYLAVYKTI